MSAERSHDERRKAIRQAKAPGATSKRGNQHATNPLARARTRDGERHMEQDIPAMGNRYRKQRKLSAGSVGPRRWRG